VEKKWGDFFFFFAKNVLLLKFGGLLMHFYGNCKPVSVIIRNSSETVARMSLIFHSMYLLNSRIMFGHIRNSVIAIKAAK
jgi:hypothetical protein